MSSSLSLRRQLAPSGVDAILSARFAFALFLGSIFLVGAPQLRAQSDDSQQNAQDVAEAARQARARKQQPTEPKHVYTNEEIHRAKILTPEDQARAAAANRKQPVNPAAKENAEPLDANSAPAQEPLGDVARRYRNARRDSQKNSPFHLPPQPEFAAPRVIAPLPAPMLKSISPARPKFSPNPNVAPAPNRPSIPSHRIDPFARRHSQPIPQIFPSAPRAPQPDYSAIAPRSVSSAPSTSRSIIVQQGDTLWTLSRQHLGRATRWLELMAANPAIADPTRLVPGTSLIVPTKTSHPRTHASTITVGQGDSLSKIARATYGHASSWTCIARANAGINDPNLIFAGQSLLLPTSCTP
jgi:nucleoid-associated protein YgaU